MKKLIFFSQIIIYSLFCVSFAKGSTLDTIIYVDNSNNELLYKTLTNNISISYNKVKCDYFIDSINVIIGYVFTQDGEISCKLFWENNVSCNEFFLKTSNIDKIILPLDYNYKTIIILNAVLPVKPIFLRDKKNLDWIVDDN